jgi:hypothetical protein
MYGFVIFLKFTRSPVKNGIVVQVKRLSRSLHHFSLSSEGKEVQ